jgi:hypothetical protein
VTVVQTRSRNIRRAPSPSSPPAGKPILATLTLTLPLPLPLPVPRAVHKKTIFDEYVFVCFTFVLTPVIESAYLYRVQEVRDTPTALQHTPACTACRRWETL